MVIWKLNIIVYILHNLTLVIRTDIKAVNLMADMKHMCNPIDTHWRKYEWDAETWTDKRASLDTDFRLHVSIHCTKS